MVQVSRVIACPECRTYWPVEGPARCSDPDHDHRQHEVHRHLDRVALPDGTTVVAASFTPPAPYLRERPPDHGLYLDQAWSPPWPHDHLDWPDFGVPADTDQLITTLRSVLDRARSGQRVELGCLGGHGRTGTALAVLAVLAGRRPDEAVAWVRTTYCDRAVETAEQEALVAGLDAG
ncbi:protein-tyrosine phosphatase family protein [Microlunatus sp. GCM10028923]|uniref:protein-tyrosine phosphatase family protein n=1 Tax=Microlunatus sp. GCM10028923 TaxID=3273400 RepID=UPI0036131AB0